MVLRKLSCLLIIAVFFVSQSKAGHVQPLKLNFASIAKLGEQEVASIVLPQIYQQIQQPISITPLPANRAQHEANRGIKDGEILRIYSYGEETPNVIRVPTPYYYFTTAAFSRKNTSITINRPADLAHYRIGVVRGVKHTENATKKLSNVSLSNSTRELFHQLSIGNIDIALTSFQDGQFLIKQLGNDKFKVVHPALVYESLFHYLNKKHEKLVTPINQVIKRLKATGELEKMLIQAQQQVYR
ncbi:transporter substrate-binding domain-containing protein [Thalassotalea sp. G2M2-11]|uniref:substrate-binding periplasmic protein n=1 Tax=Thalassotalea sp. G2M2-11 TaxID=2787627 RepID=UPI0019D25E2E|nr:transporter substrate-binding domain-containing protein [Thalassotalea sp. G2M2-11]